MGVRRQAVSPYQSVTRTRSPRAERRRMTMRFSSSPCVFGHGYVQNGVFFHTYPFTPPAVRPEVMCFWERKKMMSTGSDTIMDAAANTGQEPLVSVAWRA